MEADVTETKHSPNGYKYLLVFIDTFSGWVKTFPTKSETAVTVTKMLFQQLILRFQLSIMSESDNGPPLVAKISKDVARILNIT